MPTGTVCDAPNFNAVLDAQNLRKALDKFMSADEKVLIDIIARRSNAQRQEIKLSYKTQFGRDLIEDIISKTTGNFETLLVALLTSTVEYHIGQLRTATKGLGTDEEALIEFLSGFSNTAINTMKEAYKIQYKKELENDIKSDTSGHFRRLLISLCTANRDENIPIDRESAKTDAKMLLEAGEQKMGTDESTFNMIFCRRSFDQIKVINEEYEKLTGHSLEIAISKEFSGYIKTGLLAILHCSINKPEYFAIKLHESMAGMGTTDKQLIRIIVARSEFDLLDVKMAFQIKYGESLKKWIEGDTSGSYKNCLLTIIGEA